MVCSIAMKSLMHSPTRRLSFFDDELAANNPKDTYNRQDKEGCWRILTFYKIAADSDTETE